MKNVYKKDWSVLKGSVIVTVICTVICIYCAILADAVVKPFEAMLAISSEAEVVMSSNVDLFTSSIWTIPLGSVTIFILSFLMLNYLQSGFQDGIFRVPYERDARGRKISTININLKNEKNGKTDKFGTR